MSVSAKAGPWLELIPLDAVTFAAMHMSAFGTKWTSRPCLSMSAIGGKADIEFLGLNVR
jgi:hypothetical protein